MPAVKTHIILNPTAGGGKAGRCMQELLRESKKRFGRGFLLHVTGGPLDATRIAREAVDSGGQLIIAAGGDGTANETVNGLFINKIPVNPSCALGILDFGTGRGISQTLGLPESVPDQLDYIIQSDACLVDLGSVSYFNSNGRYHERLFISECQTGIGSAVVERVHARHKFLGGKIGFGIVALAQVINYRANAITVQVDGHLLTNEKLIGVVVGNGNYCAGGMKLTPTATPNDGYLNVLCIREMPIPERLLRFPKIYNGDHIHSEHFTYLQARNIILKSEDSQSIESDGELLGMLPCDIRILPSALYVRFKPPDSWNR